MDFVELKANLREERGKELNKKLRNTGMVPGIVYRKGEETLSLKIDSKSLSKALRTEAGENVIIKLFVEGDKKKKESQVKEEIYVRCSQKIERKDKCRSRGLSKGASRIGRGSG